MTTTKVSLRKPNPSDALEWSGCIVGLLGAALLATNTNVSPLGWLMFLTANFLMMGFAHQIRRYGLLVQQLGFTATSVLGICRADYSALHQLLASIVPTMA